MFYFNRDNYEETDFGIVGVNIVPVVMDSSGATNYLILIAMKNGTIALMDLS